MTAAIARYPEVASPVERAHGLTAEGAARALERVGPNELAREQATPRLRLLLRQVSGVMTWLLIAACGIAAAVGEVSDAIAIAVILVVNALLGFIPVSVLETRKLVARALRARRRRQ